MSKCAHCAHECRSDWQRGHCPVAPHAVSVVHLHLACCTPNLRVVEVLGVELDVYRRWFTELPEQRDGWWSPFPDRPGLGLELDPRAVARYGV